MDTNGACRVTLNQEISAAEWDKKDLVKEQAIARVKRVMAFKQTEFDVQRQIFKDALEQKSLEANDSVKE